MGPGAAAMLGDVPGGAQLHHGGQSTPLCGESQPTSMGPGQQELRGLSLTCTLVMAPTPASLGTFLFFSPSESLHAGVSPLQSDSCIYSTHRPFLPLGITSAIPACVGRGFFFLRDHPRPTQQRGLWLGHGDARC